MSMFQSVIDRQIGLHRPFYYDYALSRLAVEFSVPGPDEFYFYPKPPIYACEFAASQQYKHYLALADEDGRVSIFDVTRDPEDPILSDHTCHSISIFDIAWMPNHSFFITASGDRTVRLWDLGTGDLRWIREFRNHSRTPRVVVFRPEDCCVFASGGCDGKILIWDTRCNNNVLVVTKPENSINNSCIYIALRTRSSNKVSKLIDDRLNNITGLAFQDDNTLISCGSTDRNIKVWDLRKSYTSWERDAMPMRSFPYAGSPTIKGYSNIILDQTKLKLYANCLNDKIYCYNVGTYNDLPEQTYTGLSMSCYTKPSLSPDGKYLISGSIGEDAYIWNVKYSNPILRLKGHSDEVTCAVWSQLENTLIVTCSCDEQLRIWTIGQEITDYNNIGIDGRAVEF